MSADFTERRLVFRSLLERPRVVAPVSVWDPVSAHLAASMGFEVGLFAGSVASHVVLGAPDIVLLTLTELVEQTRRITRASALPLIVDADHGYGNSLNLRRTVEELEAAGAAALTLEDTLLPRRYGAPAGEVISREEYRDKLRAGLSARSDPALTIVGRTGAAGASLDAANLDEAIARVRIATEAGVDAIFVLGTNTKAQIEAVHTATHLPIVVNTAPAPPDELAALGVRLHFQGHAPYFTAMRAIYDAYAHLREGGTPAALRDRLATPEQQAIALDDAEYARLAKEFLGLE